MIFTGLPLAALGAIFASVGFGVLVLYVLKLRRRVVAVPFSPLWDRVLSDKDATTLFSKLRRLLSLLLQLALLALLVLALGDPRAAEGLLRGRTVVVLLDASASMQATDVAPSRFARAKEEVKRVIQGLGGADRMLLAQMDATVTPLGSLTGDTTALERELGAARATDARADFPRALRVASDVLRGASGPGDRRCLRRRARTGGRRLGRGAPSAGAKLTYVKVGSSGENVGITQFSVRRYPARTRVCYEVMLELFNAGSEPADVELQLLGDGALVDLTTLRLKPGERLPRFYPQLSGASRTLEAKIAVGGGRNDLAADDHAYALLPARRRARVLVVTEGNTYLEAALLLDEYLDVTDVKPGDYPAAAAKGGWDAVVFDRVTPAEPVTTSALYLDPSGPGSPVKLGRDLKAPSFDKIDRKHPAVRFAALDDVNVSVGHQLVPEAGDKVLGASDGGAAPILVAGTRAAHKFVALGFDVRDSDLPLRVAWPLFVVDCLNWFTDEDADYLSTYRTGDTWHVLSPGPGDGGDARGRPTGRDPASCWRTTQPGGPLLGTQAGFYEVSVGAEKTSFAASLLDLRRDSQIDPRPRHSLVADGQAAGEPSPASRRACAAAELWIYLLLAAVLLTALEWATYHRRLTV